MAKRRSATPQTGRSVLPVRSNLYWRWYFFYHCHVKGRINWWLRRWRCEDCGVWWKNEVVHAMTQYHYEGEPNVREDPNRDLNLCPDCKERYVDNWTHMWDEYRAGLL